jgi:hypothetical protein
MDEKMGENGVLGWNVTKFEPYKTILGRNVAADVQTYFLGWNERLRKWANNSPTFGTYRTVCHRVKMLEKQRVTRSVSACRTVNRAKWRMDLTWSSASYSWSLLKF